MFSIKELQTHWNKNSFISEDTYDMAVSSLTENELLGLYKTDSIGQKSPVAPFLFKAVYRVSMTEV